MSWHRFAWKTRAEARKRGRERETVEAAIARGVVVQVLPASGSAELRELVERRRRGRHGGAGEARLDL